MRVRASEGAGGARSLEPPSARYPTRRGEVTCLDCRGHVRQNSLMHIGYAQALDDQRTLKFQFEALREVGCDGLFNDGGDNGSLAVRHMSGFTAMVKSLGQGDVPVVRRLDGGGRSASESIFSPHLYLWLGDRV
jgi:hypothetical protein